MPTISAIIPVYNRPELVKDAIRSALGQTRPANELIVVDDGSTDATADAVLSFGEKVKLIRQEHKGPAAARNLGVRSSTGDWLAFLDSDDLWRKHKLARQEALILAEPGLDLIHTDGWVVPGETVPDRLEELSTFFHDSRPAQGDDALRLLLGAPMLTPSLLFRRETFEKAGAFDESYRYNEDADLILRAIAWGARVGFVSEPLVIIRDLSRGQGQPRLISVMESERLLSGVWDRHPQLRPVIKSSLYRSSIVAARYAMREDRFELARHYLVRSFFFRRPGFKNLLHAFLLSLGGEWGRKRVKRAWRGALARLR